MLEDYEGSRAEFMKMLAEQDGPPAYVLRGQRVEQVWNELLQQCRRDREELLDMPRTRLAQVAALIDQRWSALEAFVANDHAAEYYGGLFAEWQPELRVQLDATTSDRKIRASLRELAKSFERFNTRWEKHVSKVSLSHVNFERDQYNDYYLVEKSAALGSDRIAEMGFERLKPCTHDDIRKEIPALVVPAIR